MVLADHSLLTYWGLNEIEIFMYIDSVSIDVCSQDPIDNMSPLVQVMT